MNGRHSALRCIVLFVFLLGACAKTPEAPVAKTNPDPTQRYEITVKLFDPPADIKSITGQASFSIPNVICMPTPDRIAGYTPGSRYIKEFVLTRASEDTYKGHIFLDWPINEDYYGLGVCKWELGTVDAVLTRESGLTQVTDLFGSEVRSEASNLSFCRKEMRDKFDRICLTPIDADLIRRLQTVSFTVSMSSRRN